MPLSPEALPLLQLSLLGTLRPSSHLPRARPPAPAPPGTQHTLAGVPERPPLPAGPAGRAEPSLTWFRWRESLRKQAGASRPAQALLLTRQPQQCLDCLREAGLLKTVTHNPTLPQGSRPFLQLPFPLTLPGLPLFHSPADQGWSDTLFPLCLKPV